MYLCLVIYLRRCFFDVLKKIKDIKKEFYSTGLNIVLSDPQ